MTYLEKLEEERTRLTVRARHHLKILDKNKGKRFLDYDLHKEEVIKLLEVLDGLDQAEKVYRRLMK